MKVGQEFEPAGVFAVWQRWEGVEHAILVTAGIAKLPWTGVEFPGREWWDGTAFSCAFR